MNKYIIIILLITLISCSEETGNYHKTDNTIQINTPRGVTNLEIISDQIIRATTTPGGSIVKKESLSVIKKDYVPVKWNCTKKNNHLVVSTDSISVKVNLKKGHISFYDKSGNVLLEEHPANNRRFTPVNSLGEQTYHLHQTFKSNNKEAFYGLGQHQNRILNYQSYNVDLWQSNTVAAVPFVLSSKNYGILWDNYSRTRFGTPEDAALISGEYLLDKNGNSGGLSGEYFSGLNFENKVHEQTDSVLNFYFEGGHQHLCRMLQNQNKVSVRWTGYILPDETGEHTLKFYNQEYFRVFLDDSLVVDNWRQQWLPWYDQIRVPLTKGMPKKVLIEWRKEVGRGFMNMSWYKPSQINTDQFSLWSEAGDQIEYYFIYGNTPDQVISGYRQLTGKAPIMPRWSLGLWQSRERYKTGEELIDALTGFREKNIPLDNIVQDWRFWKFDQWGSHETDPERFPDMEKFISEVHKQHAHMMITVWPMFDVATNHFAEYQKNNQLLPNAWKTMFTGRNVHFYDVFNPEARKTYWKQINDKLFSKGMDAFWLDGTEPDASDIHSPELLAKKMTPNALGSGTEYLNAYSLMNCKAVYEGQRETTDKKRVFILTRSTFAGQQRYSAANWSGDIAARWNVLKDQIPAGLNNSMSGIPYWTTDIGGFAVESRFKNPGTEDKKEWRELFTRWYQYGTFCPIFRVHGQFPYREPWNITDENSPTYKTQLKFDKLRYQLMPYIYSLAAKVYFDNYTIMRALPMDFMNDIKVHDIIDQFMFGPYLLINPVTDYKARSRKLYLPANTTWYNYWTNERLEGGRNIVADAPLEQIPIFVKAGAILPMGPVIQFSEEKSESPIEIIVYPGADGKFVLYQDEGNNYNYENGDFAQIPLSWNDGKRELVIEKRTGQFPGMRKNINLLIRLKGPKENLDLSKDEDIVKEICYTGDEIRLVLMGKDK